MTLLRQRMLDDMRVRNLPPQTQASYLQHVARFARHFGKSPDTLGPDDIRAYQVYLTNTRQLAPSSLVVTTAALRFFYGITLKKDWPIEAVLPVPKRPQTLPVVLSPEEVQRFLACVADRKHHAVLTTCYAAGLRISEAVRLKVADVESQRMVLRVDQGKGQKDRYVMLSQKLLAVLRAWWRVDRPTHWLFPGARSGTHLSKGAVRHACQHARWSRYLRMAGPQAVPLSGCPSRRPVPRPRTRRRLARVLAAEPASGGSCRLPCVGGAVSPGGELLDRLPARLGRAMKGQNTLVLGVSIACTHDIVVNRRWRQAIYDDGSPELLVARVRARTILQNSAV